MLLITSPKLTHSTLHSVWEESTVQGNKNYPYPDVSPKSLRFDVCHYKSSVTAAALSALCCSPGWWRAVREQADWGCDKIRKLSYTLQTIITFWSKYLCVKVYRFILHDFLQPSVNLHASYNITKSVDGHNKSNPYFQQHSSAAWEILLSYLRQTRAHHIILQKSC